MKTEKVVNIPAERFYEFLDKFDEYLGDERDSMVNTNNMLASTFSRVSSEGLDNVAASIDGLNKAVSRLLRVDKSGNTIERIKETQQIINNTKEIQNNTEVIWEETATGNTERRSSESATQKLLREIRNPLESLSYTLQPDFMDGFSNDLITQMKRQSLTAPTDGLLVRLNNEQMEVIESGMMTLGELKAYFEKEGKETKTDNQKQKSLLDSILGWLSNDSKARQRSKKKNDKNDLKNTLFGRVAYAQTFKVLNSIRDGIFDLRVAMAFNTLKGIFTSMTALAKNPLGKVTGKLAGGFLIGDYVMDGLTTVLDGLEQNSPQMIADLVKSLREKFNGFFDALFGESSELAKSTAAGFGALTLGPMLGKLFLSLIRTVIPLIPALVSSPAFITTALVGAGALLIKTLVESAADWMTQNSDEFWGKKDAEKDSQIKATEKRGPTLVEGNINLDQKDIDVVITAMKAVDLAATNVAELAKDYDPNVVVSGELYGQPGALAGDALYKAIVDKAAKMDPEQAGYYLADKMSSDANFAKYISTQLETFKPNGAMNLKAADSEAREAKLAADKRDQQAQLNVVSTSSNVSNSSTTVTNGPISPDRYPDSPVSLPGNKWSN